VDVQHIPHKKIDKELWNNCINNALHGSLYATSLYLDTLTKGWDALVVNNYEIVMPLIHKKKYGIGYLYQPPYLPEIGIFSIHEIDNKTIEYFLEKCFSIFKFAEIAFSFPITFSTNNKHTETKLLNNFVLQLNNEYEVTQQNYLPSFHKSLRRLQKLSLAYSKDAELTDTINKFKGLYLKRISSLKEIDLQRFEEACKALKNDCIIRQVKNVDGIVLASVLLLKYKNRLYNMQSFVTAEGKIKEANYFLYDKIIAEFSGADYILDFEGSSIKGIAAFYEKMCPVNKPSFFIKYNNLPRLVKMIKK
jgi:hypothetical protein